MTDTIRILSLNTWKNEGDYPARVHAMASGISALKPDVVCLQEAFATVDSALDTARTLARHLGASLVWLPARRKRRQGTAHPPKDSWSGLAILSRLPVARHLQLQLASHPDDGDRGLLAAQVATRGRPLWVGNTHLCHLPDAADWRSHQLGHALAAMVRWGANAGGVLCGDFNAPLDSPELSIHLKSASPKASLPEDAFQRFDSLGTSSTSTPPRAKITHRRDDGIGLDLDHVLLWPGQGPGAWHVHRSAVVLDAPGGDGEVLPSDHAGVMVDLAVPA